MNQRSNSLVEDEEVFARAKSRLVFRDRSFSPTFLLPNGFRGTIVDAMILNEQALDIAGHIRSEYFYKNADYNYDALIRDFHLIIKEAIALNWLHVPVVTLRSETYVEDIGGSRVFIDDVGSDLLVLLITACHETPEFPLSNGLCINGSIKSEVLYVGLLHIYLSLHLTSQSESGQRLAAALYSHDHVLFDTIVECGKGFIEHAGKCPSVRIIRKNMGDWVLNHERYHLVLDESPSERTARWQSVQDVLEALAGQTNVVLEAVCQFSKIYPFLRDLNPESITAEEILSDYAFWEAQASAQLVTDGSISSMMSTMVAGQNFINALARISEMRDLVAPVLLNGVALSIETIAKWEIEILSRRWICLEVLSNMTVGHHHAKVGWGSAPKPSVEQASDFVMHSDWIPELKSQLVPHLNARHQIWTRTQEFLNPSRLKKIALSTSGEMQTQKSLAEFNSFVERWQNLCVSIWKDWGIAR